MSKPKIIANIFFACLSTIINVIIQFFLIFAIIYVYGVGINGFVQNAIVISSFIVTTRGAVAILTSSHLYRALVEKDYELANNIIATAHYRNRIIGYVVVILIFLLAIIDTATIFLNPVATQDTKNFSSNLTVQYFYLLAVFVAISLKNVFSIFFTAARETLIYASRKNYVVILIQLIAELVVITCTFYLISIKANIILPFLCFGLTAIINSGLVYLYTKQKFPWLKIRKKYKKYHQLSRDIVYFKMYQIGNILLTNCDIIIVVLILGFQVSSIFSIYMLIAVALRVMLVNCFNAWQSYYSFIVAVDGRLYWKEYRILELIAFAVASFAFVIQFMFTPYLINAFYNNTHLFSQQEAWTGAQLQIYHALFLNYHINLLLSIITSLIIITEPFDILLYAKRYYPKVAYKTLTLGIFNVLCGGIVCLVISQIAPYHAASLALYAVITVEMTMLICYYGFLWLYNWIYLTYNSSLAGTLRNWLIWGMSVLTTVVIFQHLIFSNVNLTFNSTNDPNHNISGVARWKVKKLLLFLLVNWGYAVGTVLVLTGVAYIDFILNYLKKITWINRWLLMKKIMTRQQKKYLTKYDAKLIFGNNNHNL